MTLGDLIAELQQQPASALTAGVDIVLAEENFTGVSHVTYEHGIVNIITTRAEALKDHDDGDDLEIV